MITYKLRPEYSTYGGGVITYGQRGLSFDVGAALTAGQGLVFASDKALVQALDQYPPLFRFSNDGQPLVRPFDVNFRSVSLGEGLAATDAALESRLHGEGYPRLTVRADGVLAWGAGAGAPDVSLYRADEDLLGVTGSVAVDGNVYSDGHLLPRVVAGRVAANGTGTGTGYSVSKTGTGTYRILYDTPFESTPAVTATLVYDAGRHVQEKPASGSAAGVTIIATDGGSSGLDLAFNFVAVALAG